MRISREGYSESAVLDLRAEMSYDPGLLPGTSLAEAEKTIDWAIHGQLRTAKLWSSMIAGVIEYLLIVT